VASPATTKTEKEGGRSRAAPLQRKVACPRIRAWVFPSSEVRRGLASWCR
jgi:hypothetical protein